MSQIGAMLTYAEDLFLAATYFDVVGHNLTSDGIKP